jgi:hypothetical protein
MKHRSADRSAWRLLLAAGAATIPFGLAFAAGWEPGVRGEWVWRANALPVHLWPVAPPAAGLFALVLLVTGEGRWERLRGGARLLCLLTLVIVVAALQCALLNAVGVPWAAPGAIVASPSATTYFAVSLDVQDVGGWLSSYAQRMPELPHHAATHPPGLVLFFLLVRRTAAALISEPGPWLAGVAEAYEVFGIGPTPQDAGAAIASAVVIAVIGALGLIPLYMLVRELAGVSSAICAACLAAGMPGLVLLGASPDLIVMTLAICILCTGYLSWRRHSAALSLLAGAVLGFGLFFSLALAVVGLWGLLWLTIGILGCADRRAAVVRAAPGVLAAVCGCLLFNLALYLVWGYRPIAVVREALSAHRDVTTVTFARTYWKWVLMNPVECVVFAGVPLTLAAVWGWRGSFRDPQFGRLRQFLASWLVLLALLDLSGSVRGEVGRIWLFLMWPAAAATGAWVGARRGRSTVTASLVLFQLAQAMLMRRYLTIYDIL